MSDCSPSPKPKTKDDETSASGEDPADIVKLFKSFQVEEEERVKSRAVSVEAENDCANLRQDSVAEDDAPEESLSKTKTPPPSDEPHSPKSTPEAGESAASPSRTRNRESSSQNFTDILAALSTLPSLPSEAEIDSLPAAHFAMIDNVMARVICDWRPSSEHEAFRQQMFLRLESYIYRMFRVCRLHAFGSSVNGFEFAEADLDCTLALPSKVDAKQHVLFLANYLAKSHGIFYNVDAVTSCRVPIVRLKMKSISPNFEDLAVDISIGNMLGIRNSAMLRRYSMIDRRVRPLGELTRLSP